MKRKMMGLKEAQEKFPVGTKVKFFPIAREPQFELSEIRSECWALGHGQVVVAINGRAGGVAVEHLQLA